ncbi:GPI mannosyltransferase 3 isoform X2 [Hyalella azteca]|uniref:Mannosyltransferase n=1 Tax=Hyalella azteca TaxID=294128 RepID=A0A8B7P2A6_HYAAZ|nr:GPI mannosyltransferase 3 isoform X2 [Hyalella azteca]
MFLQFLFLRFLSVIFVQTYFVPDEYWQSLEVAHRMVFGYGYLTWEWHECIRSIFFPGLFAVLYKVLAVLRLDYAVLLAILPRIGCAALMALSDVTTVKLADKLYGKSVRRSVCFCLSSCWFLQYCASRTISGVPETAATMLALASYPWNKYHVGSSVSYLWWVGLGCALRPTTAVMFVPLFAVQLVRCQQKLALIFKAVAVTGVVSGIVCIMDSLYYGQATFVPWNFVKFNVLTSLADHYGRHPWHWYLTTGLPSALGPHTVLLLLAVASSSRTRSLQHNLLLASSVFTLAVYSMIGHKEIRLLLPVLPPLLVICGHQLSQMQRSHVSSRYYKFGRWGLLLWLLVPSVVLVLYFGLAHQRGALTIMSELRALLGSATAPLVLFLTPCHATPLYSHLHIHVPVRFLTCEPNLNLAPSYVDESDRFFQHPDTWLAAHLPSRISHSGDEVRNISMEPRYLNSHSQGKDSFCCKKSTLALSYQFQARDILLRYPTHIVIFDSVADALQDFLRCSGYELCAATFHSLFRDKNRGKYIQVYCLKESLGQ